MSNNISVAVIGKSGQAARLISIVREITGVDLRWVYYPEKVDVDELTLTDDFDKILECDAIIIASPTYTHADYLKRLQNFKGYILVEKPAVSTKEETKVLKECSDSWKKRVKVNYNFQHSQTAKILNNLINNPKLGKIISLNIQTSHGLAFSDKYKGSWRNNLKYSFGVLELVGTHYINLAINLFGPIRNFQASCHWKAEKKEGLTPDTVFLTLIMEKDIQVNLYHSYAGPYFNRILLIGTNGYFDYDGKTAKLCSPRDVFDSEGRFTSPPILKTYKLDYSQVWKESLENSVKDFFTVVKQNREFPLKSLKIALSVMEPIFSLKERYYK